MLINWGIIIVTGMPIIEGSLFIFQFCGDND